MTLDSEHDDRIDEWEAAVGPWQPQPLDRPEPAMPRWRRSGLLLLIALGHLVGFWMLERSSRISLPDVSAETTTLVFLLPDPPPARPRVEPASPPVAEPPPRAASPEPVVPATPAPAEPPAPAVAEAPESAPREPVPESRPESPRETTRPMVAVEAAPRPGEPLRLFDADGSLQLPDDVVARMDAVDGDQRQFDFQMPGLMESGRFMDRQPVLVYEPTRFDQYWIPEKDILTSVLEKAVEATTGTVEIPIPGSPGSKLVCTVSVLAMGGGCGIRNKNDGYVVSLDDPDTLDPEEDAQCRAWWDQIVAADDQDTWRHTRELYEFSCRKPLEKDTAPPG